MSKRTIVVSAFPACGKSYICDEYNGRYHTFLDSDSSQYSWIYKDGVKTSERNPNFIDDYISHIKENIGEVDCIFVSSHKEVRQALKSNEIKFFLMYPSISMKDEMLRRMKDRGNTEDFIKFQKEHFEEFVADAIIESKRNSYCFGIELNEKHPYITYDMLEFLLQSDFDPTDWWNWN